MRPMNLKGIQSVCIGCLVTLFLTLPLGEALAVSMKEHTAKLVEGAKKEGKMVWYTTIDINDAHALLKGFEKKYPFIKTGVWRSGGERHLSRIMAEARANRHLWDVVMSGGTKSEIIRKRGLTAKYLSPHRKFYPEGSKDPEGYWTDIYLNLMVIGYNTNLVSSQEAPKAWADLLDPKWKGNMGIVTNADNWFIPMVKMMGEEKGLEYMKRLSGQDLQWRTGRTLVTQLVAAGEYGIGIAVYNQRVEELKSKGAPLEWVPVDPVVPEIHPLAISSHAPHPNAARLFVDFVLSREGQEMMASFYRIPSRVDVDPMVPKLKRGLRVMPWDPSVVDEYERYYKLYRKVLMRK